MYGENLGQPSGRNDEDYVPEQPVKVSPARQEPPPVRTTAYMNHLDVEEALKADIVANEPTFNGESDGDDALDAQNGWER